jgi:hypothetical protein
VQEYLNSPAYQRSTQKTVQQEMAKQTAAAKKQAQPPKPRTQPKRQKVSVQTDPPVKVSVQTDPPVNPVRRSSRIPLVNFKD